MSISFLRRILLLTTWLAGVAHRGIGADQWLTYPGEIGPGKGKRGVLIAADVTWPPGIAATM